MDDSLKLVQVTAFDAARVEAIEAYASLEASLAALLTNLLGVSAQKAEIIFYRVINARSRCAILADLLKTKHGAAYTPFWRALEGQIKYLDGQRNQIIHWAGITHHRKPNETNTLSPRDKTLVNPRRTIENIMSESDQLTLIDIHNFSRSASKCGHSVMMFNLALHHLEHAPESLNEILQRPPDDQSLVDLRRILSETKGP